MSTKVTVDNFDVQRLGLRKELNRLTQRLATSKVKESKGINLSLDVNGMADLMESLLKLMELLINIDYQPKFEVPEIKVPQAVIPEIKIPEIKVPPVYVPAPEVTVNPNVNVDVSGIIEALDNLKFLSDRPNKPLAVRMSDGQKFIKAITALQKATDNLGVVYAGQSGLTQDEYLSVGGRSATDYVVDGTTRLTPKFSKISASSSGNNTIVSAVTGKKIRVLQMDMIASGDVNGKFQDGAGGTDITGLSYMTAYSGICRPFSPIGWFETSASTLLNLNLSGAQAVGGSLVYVEV